MPADKGPLFLFQLLFDDLVWPIVFREAGNAGVGADRVGSDPGAQYQAMEGRQAAEGHIDLAGRKGIAGVDHGFFECQALAFMDGDGPGQPDGILGEATQLFFVNPVFFLVVAVADIPPDLFFQDQFVGLVGEFDGDPVGGEAAGSCRSFRCSSVWSRLYRS